MPLIGNQTQAETNITKAADALAEQIVNNSNNLFDNVLQGVAATNLAFWRPPHPLNVSDVLAALERISTKVGKPDLVKMLFTANTIISTALAQAAAVAGQTIEIPSPTLQFTFDKDGKLVLGAPVPAVTE